MRALLLCAGLGTRLRPLTDVLPKCLMPIQGRPLLEIWLKILDDPMVDGVLINTHHHAAMVADYLAAQHLTVPLRVTYESSLLGTGGTLLANRAFFAGDAVLLAHGDNLTRFRTSELMESHARRPKGSEITMMTFRTESPSSCGIVEVSPDGMVRAFHEKVANPPSNLANAAVYVVEPTVIEFIEGLGRETVDFSTEVLPAFVNRMSTFHNDDYHRDIGTIESLLLAQFDFPALHRRPSTNSDAPHPVVLGGAEFFEKLMQVLVRAFPTVRDDG